MKSVLGIAILVPFLFTGNRVWRAYREALSDFAPSPRAFVPPADPPGIESLALSTKSGYRVSASFFAPRNGVAVIVAHGTGSRLDMWEDVKILVGAGYGVVAFDWPGSGESTGPIRFSGPEREAFGAVVDFLVARSDVRRIDAYGFSNGAALLTTFVADDPRVQRLLAVAPWADAIEHTRYEYRSWGWIRQWPAVFVVGEHIDGGNLRPVDAAQRLQGRRTLFVLGSTDDVVPPHMTARVAAAAGGDLKVIQGAGHCDLRQSARDWADTLVRFFAP